MQEEFGRADARCAVEPLLHDVVFEQVGDGEEAHALMVRHPRANKFGLIALGVVGCFIEAIGSGPVHGCHAPEVGDGVFAKKREREEAGVRRDDRAVFGSVLQCEFWDAPGLVAVSPLRILFGEAGFRDSPGDVVDVVLLNADGGFERARDESVGEGAHPEGGHHVFEHGSGPGEESGASVDQDVGAVEAEPGLLWDVALCDGDERCDASLGCEEIVTG